MDQMSDEDDLVNQVQCLLKLRYHYLPVYLEFVVVSSSEDKKILLKSSKILDYYDTKLSNIDLNKKYKLFKFDLNVMRTTERIDIQLKRLGILRGLLSSYLPTWMTSTNPVCAVAGIENTSATSKPCVFICTPKQSGLCIAHGSSEKECSRKCSYERVLSNYNFEEAASEVCSEKEATASSSNHSCARLEATKKKTQSQIPSQRGVIHINADRNSYCHHCKVKRSSTYNACQESLLAQAWAYLKKAVSDHRNQCEYCNRRRSCTNLNAKASNDSSCCKQTLFQQVRAYLEKITTNHNTDCERCKERKPCPNAKERTFIETMLDQAWIYLQKVGSGSLHQLKQQCGPIEPNKNCSHCQEMTKTVTSQKPCTTENDQSCCQHCRQKGMQVCCKHSKPVPTISETASSHTTCNCSGRESLQDYSRKSCRADNIGRDYRSCPRLCAINSLLEANRTRIVEPCKSADNVTPHKFCKHSTYNVQPQFTASLKGSLCSFHSVDYQCIDQCKNHASQIQTACDILGGYHGSIQCLQPPCQNNVPTKRALSLTVKSSDHKFCKRLDCKHSAQKVDAYCSPSQNDHTCYTRRNCKHSIQKVDACCSPPQKDHKDCKRPDCKHSTQAVVACCSPWQNDRINATAQTSPRQSSSQSKTSCGTLSCTGTCRKKKPSKPMPGPSSPGPAQSSAPACPGRCSKCNSPSTAGTPKYQEQRMVDNALEAFLDEQYGAMNQMVDKATICKVGCKCMTCIGGLLPPKKDDANVERKEYHYLI